MASGNTMYRSYDRRQTAEATTDTNKGPPGQSIRQRLAPCSQSDKQSNSNTKERSMVARNSYELKNPFGYTQTGRLTYENTEKYIDIKGVNIHYHEAGEEHADTIVFLH